MRLLPEILQSPVPPGGSPRFFDVVRELTGLLEISDERIAPSAVKNATQRVGTDEL